jgi:integrase
LAGFAILSEPFAPALEAAGIGRSVRWHTLRDTFGSLIKANGQDIKTIQALLRNANYGMTADVPTPAMTKAKCEVQPQIVRMILRGKAT